MRPRTTAALAALALTAATVAQTLPLTTAAASGPSVWIQDANDRPFTSTTQPTSAPGSISLYGARNDYEAAQILLRSTSAQTGVSVTLADLAGPAGATIPATDITARYEYNHPNISSYGEQQAPPGGGTAYYDALMDDTVQSVPANTTFAYFYQVYVPPTQSPGVYTGTATVNSSLGAVTVPVTVTVYNAAIPPTNQSTFKELNWFGSAGWDYTGTQQVVPLEYNTTMYSNAWWTVEQNIAKNMARHRNNVVYADAEALALWGQGNGVGTSVDASGTYTFDWTTFDRFVQMFVDSGAMQYIYTPTLIEPGPGSNRANPLLDTMVSGGPNNTLVHAQCAPNSAASGSCPDTNSFLNQFFAALKAHLDAKGWTNQFYMSALDEPSTTQEATAANWFYGIYDKYFPNPMTNETRSGTFTGDDSYLSTQTPLTSTYNANVAQYQSDRIAGKDLWLYTANLPYGAYMNRFISSYLDDTRLLPWLDWKVGGDGYLHWGWDYWYNTSSPTSVVDTFDSSQDGDAWLVRPNVTNLDIYDSLRSEAQTAGLQDYELLHQLSATKPDTARTLAETLITNPTTYDTSGVDVEAVHKQLLDELTSADPTDTASPFTDTFTGGDHFWSHTAGTWATSGSTYTQSSTAGYADTSFVKGRGYGDFSASVDLQITADNSSGGTTNWAGMMVRSLNGTDMDSGYLIAQRDNGQLFVYRNGTTLQSATVPGYVQGQTTHLRVVAQGNVLTIYSGTGQAPVLTVTDAQHAYSFGDIGLITGGTSTTFSNMRITPIANDPAVAVTAATAITDSSSYESGGWGARALVDDRRTSVTNALGYSSLGAFGSNHEEWVKVDLGSARTLNRVDLYPRDDAGNVGAGFPVDFTIQVSADNTNWTTVSTQTGYPRPGDSVQTFPFAAVNARYVKVDATNLSTDSAGHYFLQFAELAPVSGDLAAGRTAYASSSVEYTSEGWLLADLTNGIHHSDLWNSMGWSSSASPTATTPQWVKVDLGGPSLVSQVTLYPRDDGSLVGSGFPSAFTIETSPDNNTWTTQVTQSAYPRPGAGGQVFSFPATTARWVRVTGTTLTPDQFGTYYMQLAGLSVS